jgi:hypothetical protein
MSKKVFNLSIKDLKEILGVFKKKKRRKRNKKNINKLNVRSSSNHMTSSSFIPMNVNTLQNDNLHLINQQLQNKINETPTPPANDNILKLQNDFNLMREQGIGFVKDLYKRTSNLSNIQSKNINSSNVIRSDTFDDNIDVGTTSGDDNFQNIKTPDTDLQYTDIYKDTTDKIPEQSNTLNPVLDPMITPTKNYNKKSIEEKNKVKRTSVRLKENKQFKLQESKNTYNDEVIKSGEVHDKKIMESNSITDINAAIKKLIKKNLNNSK